jgi:hypothetical protein
MGKSNGYEGIASLFLKGRGIAINGIGKSTVRKWAQTLQPGSVILDIGCGTGIPVSKVLVDAGAQRYRELISASGLSLIDEFEDEGGNYYFTPFPENRARMFLTL